MKDQATTAVTAWKAVQADHGCFAERGEERYAVQCFADALLLAEKLNDAEQRAEAAEKELQQYKDWLVEARYEAAAMREAMQDVCDRFPYGSISKNLAAVLSSIDAGQGWVSPERLAEVAAERDLARQQCCTEAAWRTDVEDRADALRKQVAALQQQHEVDQRAMSDLAGQLAEAHKQLAEHGGAT